MEVPAIEWGLSRFQSPNLLVHLRTMWTWAALIVAFVATFSSLLRRSKRIILRFRKVNSVNSHLHSRTFYDDDGDDVSSCSSDDESDDVEEEGEEEVVTDSDEKDFGDFEEVQEQYGNFNRHFAWPELARDRSVVKFWDGLGLRFGRPNGSISLLDLDRAEILRSFRRGSGDVPVVQVASPETFLSAGEGGVRLWDARAPAVDCATWQAEGLGRPVGIGVEDNQIKLCDHVGKLTVMDLRNVRSPLGEEWWCRDGAVTECDGDGLVSWCRNAARCLTQL